MKLMTKIPLTDYIDSSDITAKVLLFYFPFFLKRGQRGQNSPLKPKLNTFSMQSLQFRVLLAFWVLRSATTSLLAAQSLPAM